MVNGRCCVWYTYHMNIKEYYQNRLQSIRAHFAEIEALDKEVQAWRDGGEDRGIAFGSVNARGWFGTMVFIEKGEALAVCHYELDVPWLLKRWYGVSGLLITESKMRAVRRVLADIESKDVENPAYFARKGGELIDRVLVV